MALPSGGAFFNQGNTNMKIKTVVLAIIILGLAAVLYVSQAHATGGGNNGDDQDQTQGQDQGQHQGQAQGQGQGQGQAQQVNVNIGGEGAGSLVSQGATTMDAGDTTVDMSDNSRVENNSSNIVMVPNNNTENCLRVWGLAFGKNGESAAFGLPFRSKKCDYEQAADDAFAQGEREIGWFWKCENTNLSKSFKDHDDPSAACLARMIGSITATRLIATQKQTIKDYEQREQELKQACNDSKNRMMEACTSK